MSKDVMWTVHSNIEHEVDGGKEVKPQYFAIDIEDETMKNDAYRRVLYTTNEMQLVLMSLVKGEDIELEVHRGTTQFFRIEEGKGIILVEKKDGSTMTLKVKENSAVVVSAGTSHFVQNTESEPLKLYTIYAPPHHPSDRLDQRQSDVKEDE